MYFIFSAYCYNGVQDDWNKETGVDCGGDVCDACVEGTIPQSTINSISNCVFTLTCILSLLFHVS